ncbi:MAG: HDOD domain-containing protein [Deltaproteobacteria bacterium]|nr:HDOD domain-containing protein [Deltaproteobacteria bacterium]
MHVLLVEEDPLVAHSLKRLLAFATSSDIDLSTATTQAEALNLLDQKRFELVISDMRNGTAPAVMNAAQTHSPDALRLAISGHSEGYEVVPLLASAQRHLAKPLRFVELERVFSRLTWLRTLVPQGPSRELLHGVNQLPPMPATYAKLTRALASTHTGASDLAAIIEQDPALASKLLQLVNSSYFASAGCVSDIGRAVVLVGAPAIKTLALAIEDFELPGLPPHLRQHWQHHSLLVANIAAHLTSSPQDAEYAFATGLLHEVGELLLALNTPDHLATLLDRSRLEEISTYTVETSLQEPPHPLLGAYLLGLWGLPRVVVEAILHHHDVPSDVGSLDGVIQLADRLAIELDGDGLSPHRHPLDDALIDELEIADELPGWRAMAVEQATRVTTLLAA